MERKIITLKELIDESTSRFSKQIAYRMKRNNIYREWSYEEVGRCVSNLSASLSELGVSKGDKVALLSENRPEWPISYLAVACLGAVIVPLDALIQDAREFLYLIEDSQAKAIILSEKYLNLLADGFKEAPELKIIISMDEKPISGVLSFERLTILEKSLPAGRQVKVESKVEPDDLLAILYTSGTTGVSKGVMLTHRNVMSNVTTVSSLVEIGPGDNALSVLPLHHTFETTAGFLTPFFSGATVTYAESLKSHNLLTNMRETGVTIMCGVPLLYKLFFEGIMRGVEEKGLAAKILFKALFAISRAVKAVIGINIGRKLFSMVHKKLGGKIRFWVSGAAAIDPAVISGFDLMGITILQGYGLTESSPILTCCTLDHNRVGSVGGAIPGVEIKIDNPDEKGAGEIIARGPNIMKGYYNKPEITAETIRDGWLYTGDIGYIDRDGYIFITGRIKDIIVTGSGLNVYPEEIELALGRIPAVAECCVLGRKIKEGIRRGMEEVIVLIIPNAEYFEKYGKEKGVKIDKELTAKALKEEIQKLNQRLPEYKRIADCIVREPEFPKTSTRKVKRYVLRKELGLI